MEELLDCLKKKEVELAKIQKESSRELDAVRKQIKKIKRGKAV